MDHSVPLDSQTKQKLERFRSGYQTIPFQESRMERFRPTRLSNQTHPKATDTPGPEWSQRASSSQWLRVVSSSVFFRKKKYFFKNESLTRVRSLEKYLTRKFLHLERDQFVFKKNPPSQPSVSADPCPLARPRKPQTEAKLRSTVPAVPGPHARAVASPLLCRAGELRETDTLPDSSNPPFTPHPPSPTPPHPTPAPTG
jgi:hypothetical protein